MTDTFDRSGDASDTDWPSPPSAEDTPASTESSTDAPPARSSGGKKRRRSRRRSTAETASKTSDDGESAREGDGDGDEDRAPRRRRRGGRTRGRADETDGAAEGEARDRSESDEAEDSGGRRSRSSESRGDDDDEKPRRTRRRGGRSRRRSSEDDSADESERADGQDADGQDSGRGRDSDGADDDRRDDEETASRPRRRGGRSRPRSSEDESEDRSERADGADDDRRDDEESASRPRRRGGRSRRRSSEDESEDRSERADGADDGRRDEEESASRPRRRGGRSRRRSSEDESEDRSERAGGADDDRQDDRHDDEESASRPRRRGGRSRRRSSEDDSVDESERADGADDGRQDDRQDDEESESRPRRRGRGRRGRRSTLAAGVDEPSSDEDRSEESSEAEDSSGDEDESRPRRRRGGRRRRRSTSSRGDDADEDADSERSGEDAEDVEEGSGSSRKKSRRRGRSRRGSKDDEPKDSDSDSDSDSDEGEAPTRRRRRGKRGGRKRSTSDVDEGAVAIDSIPGKVDFEDLEPVELPKESSRKKKRGRKAESKSSKKSSRSDEEEDEAPKKSNVILVNASDPDETRVAVVEESRLVDFQMTVKNQVSLVNDIYRGKVVNLEPAIGAAFIDFGQGRNGFLHTSDVLSCYGDSDWDLKKLLSTEVDVDEFSGSSQPDVDAEISDPDEASTETSSKKKGKKAGKNAGRGRHRARPRLPITELLGKGGSVVVQVTKDAIGDKGPTLTTYISIPGRHLVLMPSVARTGVSRKIEDEKERRRLKRILKGLAVPDGMGVIVRTAGIGATKAELKRDLEYLLLAWESFGKRLTLGRGPIALYEESDVALRVIRDLFTPETEKIVVDDEKVHERMVEFTKRLVPDAVDRIELHDGSRPLYHTYGVEQDFEKIFARRVDLASGGSIVFDQAEALVAIDVNSGKTRSDGFDFEEVALKTNLEAVPEIARQIRLRDLGGIVVVDFIDMMRMANRRLVERAFRQELASDRARSKLGRISQFGLLEMTRQRLGAGMSKMLFMNCQRCRGTGRQRTVESRAVALLRRLGSALTLKGFTKVEVRAHPDTIEFLTRNLGGHLTALEEKSERKLLMTPVPDQLEDSVLRYLRADGREVRPGGRRKR